MNKDLQELLAIGQKFHRLWLNSVGDTAQSQGTDYFYQRTWDDFAWCQENMRAVTTLLETYNPFTAQIHLRLLKDEAYIQALVAVGESTRAQLYETGKVVTKKQKGKKTKVKHKAYGYFQSESGPGKFLKIWANGLNLDVHDNTSMVAASWDADIRFSPVTENVIHNALLVFWMHHRLLPCVQLKGYLESEHVDTWHELDVAYVSHMDEVWGEEMKDFLNGRLSFTPEETVYRAQ